MSSATSTNVLPPKGGSHTSGSRGFRLQPEETPSAGFNVGHFFVLVSLIAATAAVVMSRRATPEHLVLISLTIGAAGAAAFGVYRMLAPLAASDSELANEPISARLRADLEREKLLVMRSIKELEFDRAMGKVSSSDFDEMVGRLRARALGIMKQLDQGGSIYRSIIEKELASRVGQPVTLPREDAKPAGLCACGTKNDADARFCKSCGSKL
jgi:hypothetical protein